MLGIGQVVHLEEGLRLLHALLGEGDGLVLVVLGVVAGNFHFAVRAELALLQAARHKLVGVGVELRGLFAPAGDDQRRARLVHEDGVHLVHDGEFQPALHQVFLVGDHVVAQVIKAEFIVGAVSNVRAIGGLALRGLHVVHDEPDAQAQEAVHLAHPLALELCQIVVDGDDVHAPARQRVQYGRKGCGQGLALAGLHLGDAALVQHDRAHQLHVEGALAQHAHRRLAGERVGLRQKIVQRCAVLGPGAQRAQLLAQLRVRALLHGRLQRVDLIHNLSYLFQLSLVGA